MSLLHILNLAESQWWRLQRDDEVRVAIKILVFGDRANLGERDAEEEALATIVCLKSQSQTEVKIELLPPKVDHESRTSLIYRPDRAHHEHCICHHADRQSTTLQPHLFEMPKHPLVRVVC
jgi:hypothetical protein